LQLGELGVDLGHPVAQQGLGVPAGTQALVADGQQLTDIAQAQADPLGALDEPQPLDGLGAVLAIAGCRSGRGGQQPQALVVADSGGAQIDLGA
jgi:hypothetical protein